MRKTVLSLLLCAVPAAGAWAQEIADTDAFNGKWNVSIQQSAGRPLAAKLLLTDFSGTWVDAAAGKGPRAKSCGAKKLPVTVQVSQAQSLQFTVWGAQIAPACADLTVTLRPVNEKLLEGTLATGETIRLSRP